MNPIRTAGRLASILAGLTAALVTCTAASAGPTPPPGQLPRFLPCSPTCAPGLHIVAPARAHAVITGGMPGWQITLIAAGAALLAGVLAVLADRARAAQRHATVPSVQ